MKDYPVIGEILTKYENKHLKNEISGLYWKNLMNSTKIVNNNVEKHLEKRKQVDYESLYL